MAKPNPIHHLVLEVTDLERSTRFYADVLGLEALPAENWPEPGEHACLQTDEGGLLVLELKVTARPLWPGACAYFAMTPDRWREVQGRLQQRGIADISDPKGGLRGNGELRLRVRDPDGYALDLHAFEPTFYDVPAAGRGKIVAGRIDEFPVGTVRRVAAGKFYLVHLPAGFLAISEVCTHRQFSVTYQPEHCRFYCPLHGNRYSRTGGLLHRGAREQTPPLQVYAIEFVNGTIVVDTDHSIPRTAAQADVMVAAPDGELTDGVTRAL